VVVLADEAADAYAAPGWPGRIVVTSGMLGALSPAEREVLLAQTT
jgi:Zn-dependent protease with chaperone function